MFTVSDLLGMLDRCTGNGWLSAGEALLLAHYASLTEGPMVEVGTHLGRSAMFLSQLRHGTRRHADGGLERVFGTRRLYCVDPWLDNDHGPCGDERYNLFLQNVKNLRTQVPDIDIVPVRRKVEDWQPLPAEFVYLDGDHTYEGTQAQIYKALGCFPLYVAVHDVNDSGGGLAVKKAAVEILGYWDTRIERLAVWKIRRD